MNSSTRTIFQFRPASFLKALSILGLFIIVISYSYWNHLAGIKSVSTHTPTQTQTQTQQQQSEKLNLGLADNYNWPQKIWQTSQYPVGNISTENEKYIQTWMDLNPGYQHNLLTDESILGYVKEHFHTRNPDIEELFLQAGDLDFVLQLDLVKYMVLWAEGGVYSDLDVACGKPVREWIPERFIDEAGVVLGVQKVGGGGDDGEEFGLVDWTVMAKANQPFFWFVYQRFRENIRRLAGEEGVPGRESRPYNVSDVTGRNALTQAFLAYATSVTVTKVTAKNFTEVSEPMLFGEILVLPVQAFDALVHHHEAGSWKSEPWDKLHPAVNEEQEMKEPEQEEVAEEEKNVEAEKQKQEDMKTTEGDQDLEEDEKAGMSEQEGTSPTGNSTSPAEVSTEGKVGQTIVNGTAEPSKPPEEGDKASSADEKGPTSDKPPSVQYENAEAKGKPTANDKPPSVQYENVKVAVNATESKHNTNNSTSQQATNENPNTEDAPDKDTETNAKEEAENLKAQAAAQSLEQEEKDAEAKELAEAQEKEEEKEAAESKKKEEEEEEQKAAEAQKRKEEEEKRLAEEEEEEEQKKKTAEPKWAPLNEAGVLASSNNLADYGAEFVPDE